MTTNRIIPLALAGLLAAGACAGPDAEREGAPEARRAPGLAATVTDTTMDATIEAAGVALPVTEATVGTKLMGTVTAVLVREGDRVSAGQPLVRIDARDIAARQSQVNAGIAEAEAVRQDAETQARRIKALYDDSAATRAQLDAVETAVARAEAAVRQARAGASELAAMADYSVVRSPSAGVVTRRFVDPGAFAAPGAPLVTVQDGRRLRISVSVAPDAVRGLRRGATVAARVEDVPVRATVEGVVPAPAGNMYTVNAIVENADAALLAGSAATISLPQGVRRAVTIPAAAVRRQGDLTGVMVRGAAGDELRWVRLGATLNGQVEVLGGLEAGDQIVVPQTDGQPPRISAGGGSDHGRS